MTQSETSSEIDERYIVPGLVRGLQVLQSFTRERQEQTVAEVARQIGATRSTAFRLVYTLEYAGYLRRISDGKRYQLGSRVLELGYSFLAGKDLIEVANPVLARLRDDTGTSTHLVVREGRDAVYIARFQGNTSLISAVTVGSRLPAHATAPGRVLLAHMTLSEVVALYENFEFTKYTEATPESMGDLVSLVEGDRKHGTVVSWGFYDKNVASVAVPIYDASGEVAAAISVSCPITTFDREAFEGRVLAQVERAGAEISRGLGCRQKA
ncbi:IclR family transcriptional regulator [Novosphingobium profundi]|uniref:IclR family transcriptional regulator n=1 Tax=Novosphingobium profundi TaxID=1774954 RepID=UPI001BD98CE4|nr:IclR family transcriptional regulator [Novosphingobium profundi]MBT0668145.1 IclR family transcriptional regulator [Novosphingobium profundi]